MSDNYNFPEYRVRLFLSVDLVGSTAYKNANKPKQWIDEFHKFYNNFPALLEQNYSKTAEVEERIISEYEKNKCFPKIWKAIGDELIFCCAISSCCHLCICLESFIKTLADYSKSEFQNKKLDTKGNAWVATFPFPNVALKVGESVNGVEIFGNEQTEKQIDSNPFGYDFLGKDIDAGFRIAKNSSEEELTISPILCLLLYKSKCYQKKHTNYMTRHNRPVRLKDMQSFKGVAENNKYPVLVISTCRDEDKHELMNLERDLLDTPNNADNEKLIAYLEKYLKYYKLELPPLRQNHKEYPIYPDNYKKEKEYWQNEYSSIQEDNESLKQIDEKSELDQINYKEKEKEIEGLAKK